MEQQIRRVVTTNDERGTAVVLFDGIAPNRAVRQDGRTASTLLWVTDRTPASFSGKRDSADVKIGVPPPPSGTIFRIVDFGPATGDAPAMDHATLMKEMGISHGAGGRRAPRHPAMHWTKSVDYAIVLSGEIDMLLDESEVHLRAGDVVVQQGTNHAWVNRGTDACRIAFILIDAEEGR
jgi:mannose-6-phosphate isomerase-like protein (cupin superfamily)